VDGHKVAPSCLAHVTLSGSPTCAVRPPLRPRRAWRALTYSSAPCRYCSLSLRALGISGHGGRSRLAGASPIALRWIAPRHRSAHPRRHPADRGCGGALTAERAITPTTVAFLGAALSSSRDADRKTRSTPRAHSEELVRPARLSPFLCRGVWRLRASAESPRACCRVRGLPAAAGSDRPVGRVRDLAAGEIACPLLRGARLAAADAPTRSICGERGAERDRCRREVRPILYRGITRKPPRWLALRSFSLT